MDNIIYFSDSLALLKLSTITTLNINLHYNDLGSENGEIFKYLSNSLI